MSSCKLDRFKMNLKTVFDFLRSVWAFPFSENASSTYTDNQGMDCSRFSTLRGFPLIQTNGNPHEVEKRGREAYDGA